MSDAHLYMAFAGLAVLIALRYAFRLHREAIQARAQYVSMMQSGVEPVSLHPSLLPNRCISIGACASVCPEGDVIGVVDGRAQLITPNKCIGHGACAEACPVNAIVLVFGTERRGVDIPHVKETFETNVRNIYIAGELGGMGLIRNAVTQGKQAMESIARHRAKDKAVKDVLVVGAGPAGLAATLQAESAGMSYLTVDQHDIGGSILSFPRQKIVMTQPMDIPLYGKFAEHEVVKEELLDLWNDIVRRTGVGINTHEKLESVVRPNGHFEVTTTKGQYLVRNVLLAIGRRGTPRKLGVPGENTSKVTYKLIEPAQYENKRVLIVGGGDSAVEAACTLSEQSGTRVTLSYRRGAFSRIKPKNEERVDAAISSGAVQTIFNSNVLEITPDEVVIDQDGTSLRIANDYVLVFAGGELPTPFLKKLGIEVQTKHGEQ